MLQDPHLTSDFASLDRFHHFRECFTVVDRIASSNTLSTPDAETRRAAVQGLGRLGDAVMLHHPHCDVAVRCLQTLTEALKSSPLADKRREAARAISHFGAA